MVERKELDFTLPQGVIDELDHLVEKGIYLDRGEIIREALRNLFRKHGIEPFYSKVAEKPESSG